MRNSLSFLILFSFFISSCSKSKTTAIDELKLSQYEFNAKDFLFAASSGDVPALVLFGKGGMDVNTTVATGRSALMEAARMGHLSASQLLVGAGADTTMIDQGGRDALIYAAGGGHVEIGRLLLSRGVDSTTRDNDGWTGLTISSYKGHADMVRLLAGQASQASLDEALLLASYNNSKETVSNLLSQGAQVDSRSPKELTPLMIAAKNGHYEVANLLVQNRADIQAVAIEGKNAAEMAKLHGHDDIYELIQTGSLSGAPAKSSKRIAKSPPKVEPGKEKPLVALNGSTIRSKNPEGQALQEFKLTGYKERKLPVTLKAVDGVYAIITRMDPNGAHTDVKISTGELIHGTKYRLQQIEPAKVRSNGLPQSTINTSRVRIQHIENGANHLLVRDTESLPIDAYAILTANNSNYRYVAKQGDIFQTVDPGIGERDFQVIEIRETDVALKELASAKVIRVNRRL